MDSSVGVDPFRQLRARANSSQQNLVRVRNHIQEWDPESHSEAPLHCGACGSSIFVSWARVGVVLSDRVCSWVDVRVQANLILDAVTHVITSTRGKPGTPTPTEYFGSFMTAIASQGSRISNDKDAPAVRVCMLSIVPCVAGQHTR